jgi:hypothetical protein
MAGMLVASCDSTTVGPSTDVTIVLGVENACASRARAVDLTISTGDRVDSSAHWDVTSPGVLPIALNISLESEPGALHRATATFTLSAGATGSDDLVSTLGRPIPDGASGRLVMTLACVCAGKKCGAGQDCEEIPVGSGQATCVDNASCGNGRCEAGEDCTGCATDCACSCGDGTCGDGESCETCLLDCGSCCGNGVCDADEQCANCPGDCGCVCGDAQCVALEDATSSCCTDCGGCDPKDCGDGFCGPTEDPCSCPVDCGGCCADSCGDGLCNCGETCASCPQDCPDPCCGSTCGDGQCSCGETCESCPTDCPSACCGVSCGDGQCSGTCGETKCTCPADCGADPCCGASCGDGTCQPSCGETTCGCPLDCTAEPCCAPGTKPCDGECILDSECCSCWAQEWCDPVYGECRSDCLAWNIQSINGTPVGGTVGACSSYPCYVTYRLDCPLPPPELLADGVVDGLPWANAPLPGTMTGGDGNVYWTQTVQAEDAPAVYTSLKVHRVDSTCASPGCPKTNGIDITFYCPAGTSACGSNCCTSAEWCDAGTCRHECSSFLIHSVNAVTIDSTTVTCPSYPCTIVYESDCPASPPQAHADGVYNGTPFYDAPVAEAITGTDGNVTFTQIHPAPTQPIYYTGLVLHRPSSMCSPQSCPVTNAVSVTLP